MSLQSVTFGGTDLSQYLTGIAIERSLLAEVELTDVEIPASDGSIVAGRRLRPMEIRLAATLKGQTATEVSGYRQLLAAALDTTGTVTKRLVLPDESGIAYDAYVSGSTTLDRGHSHPHVTIAFVVPDATGYTAAQRTATIGTSSTSVTRGGNTRSWPTVEATPASGSTAWRFTNESTGKYVEAQGSFNGTSKLIIDMQRQTVKYGGSACTFALASDFFPLDGATVTLKATSTATVKWHERWL